MYVLDTNLVSLLDRRRRKHAPAFLDWLGRSGSRLFLSTMTIAEMEAGALKLHRREQTTRAAEISELIAHIEHLFGDRILPMDIPVARSVAQLQDEILPRVLELSDLIIAATARVHGFGILTQNLRHFELTGLTVSNPLLDLPPETL